jgi:hypothetical protein
MTLADRYKQYAAECEHVAQQAPDAKHRALLLEMAETWRRLAERAAASDGEKP